MLKMFTSCSFFQLQEIRLFALKAAVVLSLGFLLPVAILCQEVERRHKIIQRKSSTDRGMAARSGRLVRKMYIFVKLSGLSDFSVFLLSSTGRGKMRKIRYAAEQSSRLMTTL